MTDYGGNIYEGAERIFLSYTAKPHERWRRKRCSGCNKLIDKWLPMVYYGNSNGTYHIPCWEKEHRPTIRKLLKQIHSMGDSLPLPPETEMF